MAPGENEFDTPGIGHIVKNIVMTLDSYYNVTDCICVSTRLIWKIIW